MSQFKPIANAAGWYRLEEASGVVLWMDAETPEPGADVLTAGNTQTAGADDETDSALSLSATWESPSGLYLFLTALPTDFAALRSRLLALRRSPAYRQVRFLWLVNPDASLSQWQFHSLSVAEGRVSRVGIFNLGSYSLVVPREAELAVGDEGFAVKTPDAYLTTDYGTQRLSGVDQLALPFGELAGCWRFTLTLARPESGSYSELAALDLGCRLFFPDPLFSTDLLSQAAPSDALYRVQRYPLLDETATRYSQDLALQGCWDPLQPLAGDRSFFTFAPGETRSFVALPSGYRSNLGYTIYLTPAEGSRLVFAPKPGSSLGSGGLYLVPQGEFEATVPRHADNPTVQMPDYGQNLMCGLSGIEYVKLVAGERHFVGFVPGQSAFAARYTPVFQVIQRLQDLMGGELQRSVVPADRHTTLADLLDGDRAKSLTALRTVLLAEFFPQGYSLPLEATETWQQLTRSESAALTDLEAWTAQALRASRAQAGDEAAALSDRATTAWAYVRQDGAAAVYYAQPDQSILYEPSGQDNLFTFLEVPATDLGTPNAPTLPPFPMLPYGSLTTALTDGRELELQVVNPLRRAEIRRHYEQPPQEQLAAPSPELTPQAAALMADPPAPTSQADAPTAAAALVVGDPGSLRTSAFTAQDTSDTISGATPQGLLARFTRDYSAMTELLLARSQKAGEDQLLKFRNIPRGSTLWSAFQANQLLLVVDNAEALKPYFDDPDSDTNAPQKTTTQLTIDGWTFYLDTVDDQNRVLWRPESLLIFKYYNKPLLELIEQSSIWSQAASFVGDETKIADVRRRLRHALEQAIALDTEATPIKTRQRYAPLANIARNPNWSGILGFNIPVPPAEGLPPELVALSGGIDETRFFAQYVGIDSTPIRPEGGELVVEPSSLFGLIDYEDNQPPEPNASGYNFQVLSLKVLFNNSHVTNFSSEIAITLDKLFDERTQLQSSATGRNLVSLQGSAENHNGRTTYAFSFSGLNRFLMPNSGVFNHIDIVKAQFSSDPVPAGTNPTITGRFSFWTRLSFRQLDFDIFSFGADSSAAQGEADDKQFLDASNLVVTLAFPRDTPGDRQFTFVPDDLSFNLLDRAYDPTDPKFNPLDFPFRPRSFYAKFPVTLTSFATGEGQPQGLLPVKTPLTAPSLKKGDRWYGLRFDLDLGNLGALASVSTFVSGLTVLWTPNTDPDVDVRPDPEVYVGMQLPGLSGDVLGFPLQSVIKLSFKTAQLLFDPGDASRDATYLLKLKAIVLKLLVLSLPPNGQTELLIFGNGQGRDFPIGWYAAYAKEPP